MKTATPKFATTYQASGVDTERGEIGLKRIVDRVRQTWTNGEAPVQLNIGFFANVINAGGIGLAIATDGIGSKAIVAQMVDRYDTVGIDCIAMNVNDLICVGATPLSLVDYIAVQDPNPDLLDALAKGLCAGAEMANITISGGEIAQLPDIIKGERSEFGFDLVGTAVGTVPLDKILVGRDIKEGDVIIGIESSGIHSNGLTMARNVFFDQHHYTADTVLSELGRPLGDELLEPTHIYVRESLELLNSDISVKALVHITSDGFLNLSRVDSKAGFIIDALPVIPPIFSLIQELGAVEDEEMFRVYNMGIGFCVVVSPHDADRVISLVRKHYKKAYKIGHTISDEEKRVHITQKGLIGKGKVFFKAS